MNRKYIAAFSLFLLSGCGQSTHDVAYYTEHSDERSQKVKECRNDAAKEVTADCQNAIHAEQKYKATGIPIKPETFN